MLDRLLPTFAALAFSTLLGFAIRRLCIGRLRLHWIEAVSADFGIGGCALTLWMLALASLGIRFSVWSIAPLALPLALALVLRRESSAPLETVAVQAETTASEQRRLRLLEWAPLVGVAGIFGACLVLAASLPETNWDTISHWGLKAKAFWIHQTIWLRDYDAHNYYPPHVPLLTTWLYLVIGRVDEMLARAISVCYGLGLLALVYAALRRVGHSRLVAGTLVLLLLGGANQLLQQLLTVQADLPLTFYLTGTVVSAWRWLRQPQDQGWLILSGLFAAGATWTKYEGLFLVALLALALGVSLLLDRWDVRRRLPALLVFVAAAGVPSVAWAFFRAGHGIPVESEHIAAVLIPDRLVSVTIESARYLASGRSAGLWLSILGTWAIFARRSLDAPVRFLTVSFALNLAAIVWALDVTAEDPLDQVTRAGGRLLMHVAPLGLLLLAGLLREPSDVPSSGPRTAPEVGVA